MSAQREALDSSSGAPPTEVRVDVKSDSALLDLPQELCREVVKGLLKYVLALCRSESDMDFIPVVCKVSSFEATYVRTYGSESDSL